jgi:tellurite resistance protein
MDITDFALTALQVVSPILVAALTWAAARLASFIRSRVDNEYLRGVLIRLDEATLVAVKDLQGTVVAEIKAASADGKISDAEKQRIKAAAVSNVKSYLGTQGIHILGQVLGLSDGALDRFLGAKVEAAVHDLRLTERAVSAAQVPKAAAESSLPLASTPA